ncbi:MAG: glycosyltransferase family 2 protein [Hydrogenimonas sp.]|nr:MAG: glycosyltransferase family 2 protein [Hydrogenimonas sp.]
MIGKFLTVAWHDLKRGKDPLRIFKKSYARYKKHGFDGMYIRLENEYRKVRPETLLNEESPSSYETWVKEFETNTISSTQPLKHYPLISIIMPTFNTQKEYLTKAITSVINQTYPHWELCIADDASTNEETLKVLRKFEKKDRRIKVVYRKENGHISIASNSALEISHGTWVTFLDHDDMLPPHALYEIARTINEKPEAKLIYSDEDKVDENDKRHTPHFKSDWNPDMFFSQNYITHLCAIDKTIIDKIGGFRKGVEGSQDYDLILRSLHFINDHEIIHIPKILYHWRATTNSTALTPDAKNYTTQAGIKALQDYFDEKGQDVVILEGLLPNTYKPTYPIPGIEIKEQIEPYIHHSPLNQNIYKNIQSHPSTTNHSHSPLVSLIIPTKDGYDILRTCIESIIEKTTYPNYEIIIIDNQSTDPKTLQYFRLIERKYNQNLRILKYNRPFNYSAINNFAVQHAKGEIIGLINNDIEIISGMWLTEMVQHAIRPEIGVVGAKLYYGNDTIQHAGVVLGIGGVAGHSHKYFPKEHHGYFSRLKIIQNYSAVTAACLVMRKSVYLEVGGLDEEHLKVAFNDVDLCLKVQQKGYRNLWTPYAEAYHHESISRGPEDTPEKRERFQKEVLFMKNKYHNTLNNDKYYNINLTLETEDFALKTRQKVKNG